MSIYGNNIFEESVDYSKLAPVEEQEITNEAVTTTIAGVAFIATNIINAALFVGTMAYKVYKDFDIIETKNKLNYIGKYYKSLDDRFIDNSELTFKMFSCKRFFDNNYEKKKEISGIKRLFKGFLPSYMCVLYYRNKEVYTYFVTKEWNASPSMVPSLNQPSEEGDSTGINIIVSGKVSRNSSQFFFKMNDEYLDKKFRYYYLSSACLNNKVMTTEALNWVKREYELIKNKLNEE